MEARVHGKITDIGTEGAGKKERDRERGERERERERERGGDKIR